MTFTHLIGGEDVFYDYTIDQSCRFNDDDSAYLSQSWGTPTDSNKFTISFWFKLGNLGLNQTFFVGGADVNNHTRFWLNDTGVIRFSHLDAGAATYSVLGTRLLRDPSSWYHIVLVYDTNQAADADKIIYYINNLEDTHAAGGSYPPLNWDAADWMTNGVTHLWGDRPGTPMLMDGYCAEVHLVDGQALTPSSFGETKNGIWVPKRYTGTYGDTGFYLDFADSADLGDDESGNGNDWTEFGLAAADQVEDSPTNNFCTWNSVDTLVPNGGLSDGNLTITGDAVSQSYAQGTMLLSSGKWYYEFTATGDAGVDSHYCGFRNPNEDGTYNLFIHSSTGKYLENDLSWELYGDAWDAGDIIGIAIDIDGGTVEFFNNNVSQGVAYSGQDFGSGVVALSSIFTVITSTADFGQLGFTYTPPTGYKALCSKYLPNLSGVVDRYLEGDRGFDAVIYEGTGAEKSITSLEFTPSLIWIKNRDAGDEHVLTDTIRGATKELNSNSVNAESTVAQGVKSFDSDGFTLGTDDRYNTLNESFVAWCWKEDPDYGFDIVSYTGTGVAKTEAHNLGVVPEMMIVKNLSAGDATDEWFVYHKDNTAAPETDYLVLNDTDATADASTIWNDTAPTSSVFSVGTGHTNVNTENYIAYLFASIEGFSKVFSYTGNGSADGPLIHCGFRPRFILYKPASIVGSWVMIDTERQAYNVLGPYLLANDAAVEADADGWDFLANGFKARASFTNGATYIGIAFAETPFKYANAR